MDADAPLLDQLRAMHAEVAALLDQAPFARLRAERILAEALALVADDQRVWETTVSVLEERIAEMEDALEPGWVPTTPRLEA